MKRSHALTVEGFYADTDNDLVLQSQIPTPFRLTQEEMDTWKIKVAGFEFYRIPILACIKCGTQATVAKAVAPDRDIYYYIKFLCAHFKNPKDEVEKEALPDPTKPQE